MRVCWLLVFFASALVSGCGNDYVFSHVDVDRGGGDGEDGPDQPGPPDNPDPPPWNWPPDVGDVPDLYFAIAWSQWPCSWDDSLWADGSQPEEQSDLWAPCDGRNVAVVNMFGEVVDEFTPTSLPDEEVVEFLQLSGGGPGQFLHVFRPLGMMNLETSADGFYPDGNWEAWRGDSYSGEHLRVAEWDSEAQQVWLPEAGRHIQVEEDSGVLQLGLLPTDPDLLLTWPGQYWCNATPGLSPVRVNHLFTPNVYNPSWQPEEFLPAEVLDDVGMASAWNMDLTLDEDGELSALFGVTTGGCSNAPEDVATLQLVSWSSEPEESWFSPTETGWHPRSATYTGQRGTGALNLLGDHELPRWRVTSPSAVAEGTLSPDRGGYRPGPLLDPQGPTFTVIGTDTQSWAGDSLDFYHQGQVVWSIDRLKFGLQERQVYFADVILLSQKPGD